LTISPSDRIFAPGVPLRLNEFLTVNLKFNMLSANAQEHRFGGANALRPLMAQEEGTFITDTVLYILASACLHPGSGLEADIDGLRSRTVTPEVEADRLAAIIMAELDKADAHPLFNAIAKAQDIASPIPLCQTCQHAFSDHDWIENKCAVAECECETYAAVPAGPKEEAATTGRASTRPRKGATAKANGTSG